MGYGKADSSVELVYGPNITDWPAQPALSDDILLGVASVIRDEVTTTDELIPSGESSSYRSNPVRLSKLTLSRRDPDYVARAEKIKAEKPGEAVPQPEPDRRRAGVRVRHGQAELPHRVPHRQDDVAARVAERPVEVEDGEACLHARGVYHTAAAGESGFARERAFW